MPAYFAFGSADATRVLFRERHSLRSQQFSPLLRIQNNNSFYQYTSICHYLHVRSGLGYLRLQVKSGACLTGRAIRSLATRPFTGLLCSPPPSSNATLVLSLCRLYNRQWHSTQLGVTELLEKELPTQPPKPEKVS